MTTTPEPEDLVTWWWNGRWGRLARRDIKVFTNGQGLFQVEAWDGGAEGRCRRWHDLTIKAAAAIVIDLKSDSDGWQSMPTPSRP